MFVTYRKGRDVSHTHTHKHGLWYSKDESS